MRRRCHARVRVFKEGPLSEPTSEVSQRSQPRALDVQCRVANQRPTQRSEGHHAPSIWVIIPIRRLACCEVLTIDRHFDENIGRSIDERPRERRCHTAHSSPSRPACTHAFTRRQGSTHDHRVVSWPGLSMVCLRVRKAARWPILLPAQVDEQALIRKVDVQHSTTTDRPTNWMHPRYIQFGVSVKRKHCRRSRLHSGLCS